MLLVQLTGVPKWLPKSSCRPPMLTIHQMHTASSQVQRCPLTATKPQDQKLRETICLQPASLKFQTKAFWSKTISTNSARVKKWKSKTDWTQVIWYHMPRTNEDRLVQKFQQKCTMLHSPKRDSRSQLWTPKKTLVKWSHSKMTTRAAVTRCTRFWSQVPTPVKT